MVLALLVVAGGTCYGAPERPRNADLDDDCGKVPS